MATRCLISLRLIPAPRSCAQVTTPCRLAARRATFRSTVSFWGATAALSDRGAEIRPPGGRGGGRSGQQLAAEQLAGGVSGEAGDLFDAFWDLEGRQVGPGVVQQVRGIRAEDHE